MNSEFLLLPPSEGGLPRGLFVGSESCLALRDLELQKQCR